MYLVDTNVLSEQMRRLPDVRATAWLASQQRVLVSVITVMELESGVLGAPTSKQAQLTRWFNELLSSSMHQVMPVTVPVARLAARMNAQTRSRGQPRATSDLLIAATALTAGAVVVTRNVADFKGLGVGLLNPFE